MFTADKSLTPLRLLLVEDSTQDAEALVQQLRRAGYDPAVKRVETPDAFALALKDSTWDVLLADYEMPAFGGLAALALYRESGLDTPFILVADSRGENRIVEAMRGGAHDFLLKSELDRLGPTVARELSEAKGRLARRQDLERLGASKRRFTTLFNYSPLPIVITGIGDGVVYHVNPAALHLFGYTLDEVIGHSMIELGAFSSAADRQVFLDKALAQERGYTIERSARTKNGTQLTLLVSFSMLELDGQMRLMVTMQDITARKHAEDLLREREERFRLLVENSSDLVMEVDSQGIVLYVSPNHQAITGYSPAELLGSNMLQPIHPDDLGPILEAVVRRKGGGRYRYRHRDGHLLRFEAAGHCFYTSSGEEHGVIVTRDITSTVQADEMRKQLELQLRQAQKMEAIGTLAGGVAHDFNNILTGILGNLQLAELDLPETHPSRAFLADGLKACMRARDLVAQILTFSRRREQQRSIVSLGPIVKEALRLLRASLATTIDIQSDIDSDCPTVMSDPSQVHQIIMNLGTNAAHAMREHGGTLTVRLKFVEVDAEMRCRHPQLPLGPMVCLWVGDTGCGMDAATCERVFDPFFTTKVPGEGTGLGLAVVHGIMESHEGAIIVDSEVGRGTIFRLFFPAQQAVEEHAGEEPLDVPMGNGQRILIVDDEAAVVLIAERMLTKLGYRPHAFTSPRGALTAFRSDPASYDLVLSDLTMPGMTGVDLACQLAAARPGLPLIITTGYLRSADAERARQLGVHFFLEKPFTLTSLATAVSDALAGVVDSRPALPAS